MLRGEKALEAEEPEMLTHLSSSRNEKIGKEKYSEDLIARIWSEEIWSLI